MPKQALLEYKTLENKAMPTTLNAHAAATRIQAFYRSYLVLDYTLCHSSFIFNFLDVLRVCMRAFKVQS